VCACVVRLFSSHYFFFPRTIQVPWPNQRRYHNDYYAEYKGCSEHNNYDLQYNLQFIIHNIKYTDDNFYRFNNLLSFFLFHFSRERPVQNIAA
jgi:hypothetical protein